MQLDVYVEHQICLCEFRMEVFGELQWKLFGDPFWKLLVTISTTLWWQLYIVVIS